MTGNPFKPQTETPPEAHDVALREYSYYVPPGKHDFPLPPGKGERRSLWILAALATVGLMVFNFVSVPIADAADVPVLLMAMGIGAYFAQAAILSTGLVFAALPFWQRLGLHWLIAVALCSSWLLGFQTPNMRGPGWSDIAFLFLALPLFALAAQLPLWVVRLYLQWRIVHRNDWAIAERERPLSIRDLMIATVVVAISLAGARAAPESQVDWYWTAWGIVILIAAGVSVASIPPLLIWTLRVKEATWGALAIVVYAIAFALGAFVLMFIFEPSARREFWPLFLFPCVIFGYAAALSAGFWILRARGYRLKIGRDSL